MRTAGVGIGEDVYFQIAYNARGEPKAKDVRPKLILKDRIAATQRFSGIVSAVYTQFGFIKCTELRDKYGCDVFVFRTQLNPFGNQAS